MDKKKRVLVFAAVVGLVIAGYFIWKHYYAPNSKFLEVSGTIEAMTVDLTVKVPGTIEHVYARTEIR
jgi:HAMP domain-containing protein